MPVVTIARQLGSGGEEIAARVAQLLGARLLDRELLVRASERSGIPIAYLEDFDERGRSMWRHPLDLVRSVPLPPINPDQPDVTGDRYPPTGPVRARGEGLVSPAYWAAEAYASLLARTMRAEATAGEPSPNSGEARPTGAGESPSSGAALARSGATGQAVVIVGRCGNEALAGAPDTLHVLVLASQRTRLQRIMVAEQVNTFHALDRLKASDRRRAAYARQLFNSAWLDPVRYDLTVNTDRLDFDAAADLIAGAAQRPRSAVESSTAAAAV